ncbi:acetyl-CoA acetyltransferase [Vibrio phage D530]
MATAVTPLTGDVKNRTERQQFGVTVQNMPVVKSTELSAKASSLNDASQSGKREGALVTHIVSGKPVLMQAAGSDSDSLWIAVTKGGADITPA